MQRYHTLHEDSMRRFGKRTVRLSVDAGFTCPNRDGTVGYGGCSFCSGGKRDTRPVTAQLEAAQRAAKQKWGDAIRCVAYFCMYTNTYRDVETLRALYEEALAFGVDGLAIATRADCIDDEVLDLLHELSQKTQVWVELGMQTIHEKTIARMNRGYTHAELDHTVDRLKAKGIEVVLHMIVGLPGESNTDMVETVQYCNKKKIDGIKFHSLFLEEGSLWAKEPPEDLVLLEKEEYELAVTCLLAVLDPSIVVHRLTGDPDRNRLIAPLWTLDKLKVISGIRSCLKSTKFRQGIFVE